MPEGSSYLAQNSTDLSAAISPGSLYLISFCKILSHLLLEFCFPGFSHCLPVADCVFSSENLVSTFFFLVWTLPGCFFPPGNQWYMVHNLGNLEDVEGYVLMISLLWGSLPKTWKRALIQFIPPPTVCFQLRSLQVSHEFRGNISLVWGFLFIFPFFIFPFLFFFLN